MRKMVTAVLAILVFSFVSCAGRDVLVPKNPAVSDRIASIYNASVSVTDGTGDVFGAGTIIQNRAGQKMVVLTAAHVVVAMQKKGLLIRVSLAYESGWKPMIVKKIDEKKDLAILEGMEDQKYNGPMVRVAEKSPKIGDRLTVIGAPMGDERTITEGLLSNIQSFDGNTYYRVSAAVFFGNSGGGAFNADGELVGVAHAIQMVAGIIVVPGASFFIQLSDIKNFL